MPITIHLRVHGERELLQRVADWLAPHSCKYLAVYEEEANRPHMHANIEYNLTLSTFRQKLRATFKLTGNAEYGLEEVRDLEKADRYICKGLKGVLPVILAKSTLKYTDEFIKENHQKYWEINKELNPEGIKKRDRALTFVQQIAKELKEKTPPDGYSYDIHTKYLVYVKMMKSLGDLGKTFDKNVLKKLHNGVMLQLCPREISREMFIELFPDEWEYTPFR